MKRKLFTFLMAFLATLSGAVWGQDQQTYTGNHEAIEINGGGTKHVTFNNLTINADAACKITGNTTVYLTLIGTNTLTSNGDNAGIYVEEGSILIITEESEGASLKAEARHDNEWSTDNSDAAGIGGSGDKPNFGTIIIKGGNIDAHCYTTTSVSHSNGAGIGGGTNSEHGTIIIIGGTINALCYDNNTRVNNHAAGAAIGGGYNGTCDNITILGGTVTAKNEGDNSHNGHNIGVGYEYSGQAHPSIIFGKWDKNTTTSVTCSQNSIDKTNFLYALLGAEDANQGSQGNVTLPAGTQMYLTAAPTKATLNAYYMELVPSKIGTDNHAVHVYTQEGTKEPNDIITQYENLYYGKECIVNVPSNLECTLGHYFMGWLKNNTSIVQPENGTGTVNNSSGSETEKLLKFETGSNDATGTQTITYTPVWVDNEQAIYVKKDTPWANDGQTVDDVKIQAPTVTVVPTEAISLLNYEFDAGGNTELTQESSKVQFVSQTSNKLTGTPTLLNQEEYKQLENVKAKVSVPNTGIEVEVAFDPFVIFENYVTITSASINNSTLTYNGKARNGDTDLEEDELLTITGTIGSGEEIQTTNLREGVFYRIVSYQRNNTPSDTPADEFSSTIIKDAGTYSDIVIEPINGAKLSTTITGGKDTNSDQVYDQCDISGTITISPYTITVIPTPNQTYELGQTEPLNISFAPVEGTKAINVADVNEKVHYTGNLSLKDVTGTPTNVGAYEIQQGTLELDDNQESGFKKENYKLEFSTTPVTLSVLKDISDENSGVSITISGTDDLTYDGTDQSSKVTVSVTGLNDGDYTKEITSSASDKDVVKNAGDYTVTITGNKEQFYTGTKTETFTVKPITINTITAQEQTVTLGKEKDEFISEATSETVKLGEVLSGETPAFNNEESKSLLKLDDSKTYNAIGDYTEAIIIDKLELADAEDDSFLASNYEFGTDAISNATKGTLHVVAEENIEIEFPEGEDSDIAVDADGNGTMVYNGSTPEDITLTISIKDEDEPLTTNDYTVTYAKENANINNTDILNVGTYTITVTITKEGNYMDSKATKTLEVTARPLTVTIEDQTIEAEGSVETKITAETVTVSGEVEGETAVFTAESSLASTQTEFTAGTIYEGVITKGSTFALGNGEADNNFKATNYSLPESIAAADLIVKQTTDGGSQTDPIDPTDDESVIELTGDWKDGVITYDGNEHPVTGLRVKFTDSKTGTVTYKEVTVSTVTYTPSGTPMDAKDYIAAITLPDDAPISITGGGNVIYVKLSITKKAMSLDLHLPTSKDEVGDWNPAKAFEYDGLVTNCKTKVEEMPSIKSDVDLVIVNGKAVLTGKPFIEDNTNTGFKYNNYTVKYLNNGMDITDEIEDGTDDEGNVTLPDDLFPDGGSGDNDDDNNNPGHGGSDINRPAKYYNMYVDTAATCDGVELWFNKNVVREGNQASVYVKIEEGYDAEHMKLWFKRSLYGYWEELEEDVQPGEYIIYNVYTDIYVKATDVEKDPTGIEEIEGVKVYAQNGSIYVYTPNRLPVWIVSMTGAVVRNEEQVGLQQYDRLNQGIYIVRVGEQVFKIRL